MRKDKIAMKLLENIQSESTSNLVLYVLIMFANIDYVGILDYAIKAAIGAVIWFGARILAEYYSRKVFGRNNNKQKQASANTSNVK